jgi:transcriptional regulator with XRE-family HTH domain
MSRLAEDVFAETMTAEDLALSDARARELVAEYATLKQLRKARELTQADVARALGKQQVAVSRLERQADMLLSTLRGYVEGMGGRLDLIVRFADRPPLVLEGLGEPDERPSGLSVERPTIPTASPSRAASSSSGAPRGKSRSVRSSSRPLARA